MIEATKMDDRPKLIVTLMQFSEGWTVFGGFDDRGRLVTHRSPMQKIGDTVDGHVLVVDEFCRERDDRA